MSNYARFFAVILAVLTLLIFDGVRFTVNRYADALITSVYPAEPDSSILFIEFNSTDAATYGFPLKRSYYALMFDRLSEAGAVGFDIFLSDDNPSQTVYNRLLSQTIQNNGNIVQPAVVYDLDKKNNQYVADSIAYPELKGEGFEFGHVNYIDEGLIIIPAEITVGGRQVHSFSKALVNKYAGSVRKNNGGLTLNFFADLEDFETISFADFFAMLENNPSGLNKFENKIIIIGVTAPEITEALNVPHNYGLSAAALHLFAVDNILYNRGLNDGFYAISALILAFLALVLPLIKNIKWNTAITLLILIILFIARNWLYVVADYSFFVLPFFFLILTGGGLRLYFSFLKGEEYRKEKEQLKTTLEKKERQLSGLQKELEASGSSPEELRLKIQGLKREIEHIRQKEMDNSVYDTAGSGIEEFEGMVFVSDKMKKAAGLIKKAAPEDVPVLILGESGSGKELAARALHNLSGRNKNKFVAVNCAALSDTLLESELFGHVKGAFTGAVNENEGRFGAADKGTIFLDEIGETSINFQSKLLRVLQSGEYEKVGSSVTIKTGARVVAATNKDLREMVKNGTFREDLYYRLNLVTITLPPLRERKEDISVLAKFFAAREEGDLKFSAALMNRLKELPWKGNVRELEAAVKRAAIFARFEKRDVLKITDLPEELKDTSSDTGEMILLTLKEKNFSHTSVKETASELGISRNQVTEYFRGRIFEVFCQTGYNINKTSAGISGDNEGEVFEKVKSKAEVYLENIKKDIESGQFTNPDEAIEGLSAKYKNLPKKYHGFLDSIIEHFIREKHEK